MRVRTIEPAVADPEAVEDAVAVEKAMVPCADLRLVRATSRPSRQMMPDEILGAVQCPVSERVCEHPIDIAGRARPPAGSRASPGLRIQWLDRSESTGAAGELARLRKAATFAWLPHSVLLHQRRLRAREESK